MLSAPCWALLSPDGGTGAGRGRLQHELALPVVAGDSHDGRVLTDAADPRPLDRRDGVGRGRSLLPEPGLLRPARSVGHARQRVLRLGSGQSEAHTPRRTRRRRCGGTHVIVPARSYPRRPDRAEVVGTALVAAATGLGHPGCRAGGCRRPPCGDGSVEPGPTARPSASVPPWPCTPWIPKPRRWRRRAVRSATGDAVVVIAVHEVLDFAQKKPQPQVARNSVRRRR